MQTIRTYLVGLGNVNRNFLRVLEMKQERLRRDYGLAFRVVALADSSGVAVNPAGFDPASTRRAKETGTPVRGLPGHQPGITPAGLMETLACDLALDASPVNLQTGEPGLSVARSALRRGITLVLANKAPLVLAFGELQRLAQATGAGLGYSATVCGALPVINLGRRDLIAADILSLRGIFNSTSNFILDEMTTGRTYGDALAEAQQRGIAETDPSLDVEGWDTANKLVIIANSFLGVEIGLADVMVEGITQVTPAQIAAAAAQDQTIKLVAQAQRSDAGYIFRVGPKALSRDDFLAGCQGWEMGIEIHSDLYGRLYHKVWEREPLPTAAAMLRDAVNLWSGR